MDWVVGVRMQDSKGRKECNEERQYRDNSIPPSSHRILLRLKQEGNAYV